MSEPKWTKGTAPGPRLEAIAEAIYDSDAIREAGGDWPSWKRLVKIGSLDVDEYRDRARAAQDAIRAFDAELYDALSDCVDELIAVVPRSRENLIVQTQRILAKARGEGWVVDEDHRPGMAYNRHIVRETIPNERICFMAHDGPEHDHEFEQYARLIAAAPDLYAALFRLAGGWFDPAKVRHDPDCECGGCEAYRALAKARGE